MSSINIVSVRMRKLSSIRGRQHHSNSRSGTGLLQGTKIVNVHLAFTCLGVVWSIYLDDSSQKRKGGPPMPRRASVKRGSPTLTKRGVFYSNSDDCSQ